MTDPTEIWLFPRLSRSAGLELIRERKGLSVTGHEELASLSHAKAAPAATGGHPVPGRVLQRVQQSIRDAAQGAGYPQQLRGSTQDFDRPCGSALFQHMNIVAADAADEGVWSFLTLVLVPEIGPWRFPDRADERLLGRPRNVLRRLWWRAWAIGPDLNWCPSGCSPLGEDEFVQIMERPSLGGNRRTARALAAGIWRAEQAGLPVARSEVMRQLTRRLRATRSHVLLDALTDLELSDLLDGLTDESIAYLSSQGP